LCCDPGRPFAAPAFLNLNKIGLITELCHGSGVGEATVTGPSASVSRSLTAARAPGCVFLETANELKLAA